ARRGAGAFAWPRAPAAPRHRHRASAGAIGLALRRSGILLGRPGFRACLQSGGASDPSSNEDPSVTEPEDRDPAPPSPEKEVWLPPRLREKLGDAGAGGDDEDFLQRNPRNMIPGILATLIVVAVLGGVYLMIHTSQMKDRAEEARLAAAARRQTIADSLAHAREDSLAAMRAQAFHDSVFAFMKTPAGRRAFAR